MMSGGLMLIRQANFMFFLLGLFIACDAQAGRGPASWNIDDYGVYISSPAADGTRNLLFKSKKKMVPSSLNEYFVPLWLDREGSFILRAKADGTFYIDEQTSAYVVNTSIWQSYNPQVIHADFNNDIKDDLYINAISDIGADIVFSSGAAQLSDALFRVTRIGSDPTEIDDAKIRGQWKNLVRGLAENNSNAVLAIFAEEVRSNYSTVLAANQGSLHEFSNSVVDFVRMRIDDNSATYVVTRSVGTEKVAHIVELVRGPNDTWYIYEL